jgi:dephospho-CoA kinase
MIKIGITGGIGSGKSMVCKVLSLLGVPVYIADKAAKELADNDPEIRSKLIRLMGEDIYTGHVADRSKMASLIFHNKSLLAKVNKIYHEKVIGHFLIWCEQYRHVPYIVHESALLFESQTDKMFDKVITVSAPEEKRIQRVISRKDMNRDKILAIMQNQITEKDKIRFSHYLIVNDDVTLILPQIIALHQTLMAISCAV